MNNTIHSRITLVLLIALMAPMSAAADSFRASVAVDSGGRLEVDLSRGSVEVESHDSDEVEVDAEHEGIGGFEFVLSGDSGDAELVGRGSGWLRFGAHRVRVRIKLPEAFSLDIRTGGGHVELEDLEGDVKVRTGGGSIEASDVVGDLELRTSGGDVTVDGVDGMLQIATSGGRIDVSDVTGDVEARTSGGRVRVHDVGGRVEVSSSGGPISVRFSGQPEGTISTSGGGIEVEFDEDANLDLRARTSGGRVSIDDDFYVRGSVRRSEVHGEVNDGGPSLDIQTSGGNVRIQAR